MDVKAITADAAKRYSGKFWDEDEAQAVAEVLAEEGGKLQFESDADLFSGASVIISETGAMFAENGNVGIKIWKPVLRCRAKMFGEVLAKDYAKTMADARKRYPAPVLPELAEVNEDCKKVSELKGIYDLLEGDENADARADVRTKADNLVKGMFARFPESNSSQGSSRVSVLEKYRAYVDAALDVVVNICEDNGPVKADDTSITEAEAAVKTGKGDADGK